MSNPNEPGPSAAPTPTVIVYQNADFVSGLLQELYQIGILDSSEVNSSSTAGASSESTGKKGANGKGGLKAFIGRADLEAYGEHIRGQSEKDENTIADRKKFVYSQAYYMDRVRAELRDRGLVRQLDALSDAEGITTGEFVEFEASFEANEVNALLDILTPELSAEIARYQARAEGVNELEDIKSRLEDTDRDLPLEKIQSVQGIHEVKAGIRADLAAAVTAAVRADFRGDRTKEFYAAIGQDDDLFTAVTVCEVEHFVSKDPDRLLDGRFTVLAKVISEPRSDVPVLEKNKLLSRLNVDAVEDALQSLTSEEIEDYMDLQLSATIDGLSITVLPVAIYV